MDIQLLGVNQLGQESGNAETAQGRDISWLQDEDKDGDGESDVWLTSWPFTYRDVVIVDADNVAVDTFNLTTHSIGNTDNYETLRQVLIDVATGAIDPQDDRQQTFQDTAVDVLVLANDGGAHRLNLDEVTPPDHGTSEIVRVETPVDLRPIEAAMSSLVMQRTDRTDRTDRQIGRIGRIRQSAAAQTTNHAPPRAQTKHCDGLELYVQILRGRTPMKIVGYSDQFSVPPGQSIRFMVSSQEPTYHAEMVRLRHIDANPNGPGFKVESLETKIDGEYPGRAQTIHTGSHVVVPHDPQLNCSGGFTLQAWILPTTPQKGLQGLLTKWSDDQQAGYGLIIDEAGSLGLRIGVGNGQVHTITTGVAMKAAQWVWVAATYDASTGRVGLYQEPLSKWPTGHAAAAAQVTISPDSVGVNSDDFLMAAIWQSDGSGKSVTAGHYNGKIDRPRLHNRALEEEQIRALRTGHLSGPDDSIVASWNFSCNISSRDVTDESPQGLHGRTVNMPMRAVTGHNWSGREVDFRAESSEYGAIHFHDDDLEDAGWDEAFEWTVPDPWRSGIYAVRLSTRDAEDQIPFVVRPKHNQPQSRIAFLMPSVTYLAYATSNSMIRRGRS